MRAEVAGLADQAGRRRGQPLGQAHVLDRVLQRRAQGEEQILEALADLLGDGAPRPLVLRGPEVDAALAHRRERLALELAPHAQPELVDRVQEEEHLVAARSERLQMRRPLGRLAGGGRQVVDRGLPLLHPRHVVAERRRAPGRRWTPPAPAPGAGSGSSSKSEEALLEHRAELGPERLVLLGPLLLHLLEGGQEPPDEVLADGLDLAVLLEDLARDVERQVVRRHHAAHEAQVRREQLPPVVHDEHALDVERQAPVRRRRRGAGRRAPSTGCRAGRAPRSCPPCAPRGARAGRSSRG